MILLMNGGWTMIITIARECGCSGDEIGEALSEKYGIAFYNKSILIDSAKDRGIYTRYPDFFAENPTDSLLKSAEKGDDLDIIRQTPIKALNEAIEVHDCVIIGRCANYAFKDRKDLLRVFLCGDVKKRIEKTAEKYGVDTAKATEIVEETDARRKDFQTYYTGEDWGYAGNYDICLNEGVLGTDTTIDVICHFVDEIMSNE
jgi:cytidylate kinase